MENALLDFDGNMSAEDMENLSEGESISYNELEDGAIDNTESISIEDLNKEYDEIAEDGLVTTGLSSIRRLLHEAQKSRMQFCKDGKGYSQEEMESLVKRYKDGDPMAQQEMLMSVFPFIVHIATKMFNTYFQKHPEDLVQEGVKGALNSFKNYDPKKGRLTTWSSRSIIHDMQEYIQKNIHHTSTHYGSNMKVINDNINSKAKNNIDATVDDICIETGMSPVTVKSCMEIMSRNSKSVSMNDPDNFTGDTIASKILTPEQAILRNDQKDTLYLAIRETLNRQETLIIIKSAGLLDQDACSDATIAKELGIADAKVREIKNIAQEKLRKYLMNHQGYRPSGRPEREVHREMVPIDFTGKSRKLQRELDTMDFDIDIPG